MKKILFTTTTIVKMIPLLFAIVLITGCDDLFYLLEENIYEESFYEGFEDCNETEPISDDRLQCFEDIIPPTRIQGLWVDTSKTPHIIFDFKEDDILLVDENGTKESLKTYYTDGEFIQGYDKHFIYKYRIKPLTFNRDFDSHFKYFEMETRQFTKDRLAYEAYYKSNGRVHTLKGTLIKTNDYQFKNHGKDTLDFADSPFGKTLIGTWKTKQSTLITDIEFTESNNIIITGKGDHDNKESWDFSKIVSPSTTSFINIHWEKNKLTILYWCYNVSQSCVFASWSFFKETEESPLMYEYQELGGIPMMYPYTNPIELYSVKKSTGDSDNQVAADNSKNGSDNEENKFDKLFIGTWKSSTSKFSVSLTGSNIIIHKGGKELASLDGSFYEHKNKWEGTAELDNGNSIHVILQREETLYSPYILLHYEIKRGSDRIERDGDEGIKLFKEE